MGRMAGYLLKCSWHSFIARKIASRIALSEREKGMFSEEITKIHQAVFPTDVILAIAYLVKTRKSLRVWEVQTSEKEDIKRIYREVRILSGKLIPQGDESALSVITALRRKSGDIANQYLKNEISYIASRGGLFEVLSDLVTVGDILEARKEESQISLYDLLGIKKQAQSDEVKIAYRNIVPAIHPDLHPGNQYLESLTKLVNTAYVTLSNSTQREAYNVRMDF